MRDFLLLVFELKKKLLKYLMFEYGQEVQGFYLSQCILLPSLKKAEPFKMFELKGRRFLLHDCLEPVSS